MNRDEIETVRPKNAPAITPDYVRSLVTGADYHIFPGTTVTICLLRLRNGFTVTGESACANAANFDVQLGRDIAHSRALDKVFQLEAYLLKQDGYVRAKLANLSQEQLG